VSWPEGAWLVANRNGSVPDKMTILTIPQQPFKPKPTRVDFKEEALGLEWNYVQAPNENSFTLNAKKGVLSLYGSANFDWFEYVGESCYEIA